jgi:spore coat protein JC
MWLYEKRLQFPVNIKKPNAKAAGVIISQLGGPDGEMAAALRYLSQRYTMPYPEIKALLTDIGTEELAHVEIISAILYQLTEGLTMDEIKASGYDKYFVDHTTGIYPQAASGAPFTAAYFQSKGDPITDLTEDMAAEQKARTTYDNILQLVDDEDIKKPIRFLREREIVHYQRFAEALEIVKSNLDRDNYYKCNPSFNCKPMDNGNQPNPCPTRDKF